MAHPRLARPGQSTLTRWCPERCDRGGAPGARAVGPTCVRPTRRVTEDPPRDRRGTWPPRCTSCARRSRPSRASSRPCTTATTSSIRTCAGRSPRSRCATPRSSGSASTACWPSSGSRAVRDCRWPRRRCTTHWSASSRTARGSSTTTTWPWTSRRTPGWPSTSTGWPTSWRTCWQTRSGTVRWGPRSPSSPTPTTPTWKWPSSTRARGSPRTTCPCVFDAFYRGGEHPGAGTGLGLAVVRRYVDRWGGQVAIESTLGEGTRVTFTLPRVPAGGASDRHAGVGATRRMPGS